MLVIVSEFWNSSRVRGVGEGKDALCVEVGFGVVGYGVDDDDSGDDGGDSTCEVGDFVAGCVDAGDSDGEGDNNGCCCCDKRASFGDVLRIRRSIFSLNVDVEETLSSRICGIRPSVSVLTFPFNLVQLLNWPSFNCLMRRGCLLNGATKRAKNPNKMNTRIRRRHNTGQREWVF